MKNLTTVWNWITRNIVGIIFCTIIIVYLFTVSLANKQLRKNNEEAFACKTSCFPQQSEYIVKQDTGSCWCYLDQDTMKEQK